MKFYFHLFMTLAIVFVCGVSYAMIQNDETEVSANEEALGFLQPCYLDDISWVCDENQDGDMCYCGLDYSR